MLDGTTDQFQDIRDAVRALCAEFPAEYHRKVDEARAYPNASDQRCSSGRTVCRASTVKPCSGLSRAPS